MKQSTRTHSDLAVSLRVLALLLQYPDQNRDWLFHR